MFTPHSKKTGVAAGSVGNVIDWRGDKLFSGYKLKSQTRPMTEEQMEQAARAAGAKQRRNI